MTHRERGEQRKEGRPGQSREGPEREARSYEPRIWVASLADYNAGTLHGVWLDATLDIDELHEQIAAMLSAAPDPGAEDWAVYDYDDFGGLQLDEYQNLGEVGEIARGLVAHGEAYAAFVRMHGGVAEATARNFEAEYRGRWDSRAAYADQLLDDLGATRDLEVLPVWLQPYVRLDGDGFGRDLELGGDIAVEPSSDGGVYVFDQMV